jgi:hypothetical protein
VDSPTTDLDAGRPAGRSPAGRLAHQIEEGLARLDETDLTGHPAAFEAMDEAVRAELRDLERFTGDPDG